MGRKPAPQPLMLAGTTAPDEDPRAGETLPTSSTTSPSDSKSPRSPLSPFRFAPKKSQSLIAKQQPLQAADVPEQQQQQQQQQQPQQQQYEQSFQHQHQQLPHIASAIQQPAENHPTSLGTPPAHHQQNQTQGRSHQRHDRHDEEKVPRSGFFFNFTKPSKSVDRLQGHQYTDSSEAMSRGSEQVAMTKQNSKHSDSSYTDNPNAVQHPVPSLPSKSDVSLASSDYDSTPTGGSVKRGKPKPFTLLSRTRSLKDKDGQSPNESTPTQVKIAEPERAHTFAPLRTAPMSQPDRSFREMMSSAVRNHSAERSQPRDVPGSRDKHSHSDRDHGRVHPSSFRDTSGSGLLSGLKSSSSRAADMISKGLFGSKNPRGGAPPDREPVIDDEHYVLKVINRPLVEQTRLTRISKRLEDSRDKTEFWMPAFPWRAIDYLNYKGSDVEGLYRVPGSGPQIKKWQRRFDEEGDVDLFAQKDLYDINIIGSMLKAWLRELPDELFPKEAQDRIARECSGSDAVPQLLVDELSNLSPFNYYLLFAITCHLSLLLSHSDKNKMDFRNLCICFQPCMKIDAFCFKFLVCDWRDCWKGCKNEAKYIEEEYQMFDLPPPRVAGEGDHPRGRDEQRAGAAGEDRNVSSSDSSKHSNHAGGENNNSNISNNNNHQKSRLKKRTGLAAENGSVASNSTISTTLTINSETPPRRSGDLRPLSPIKPLSPLGF